MRIAVVEDDLSDRELICSYINRYRKEYVTPVQLETFTDGQELTDSYEEGAEFDVIFLDIEMAVLNGMDAAKQIRKKDTKAVLIYITNMAQYAVRGYEVEALDFIVKPVGYEIFSIKMKKAQNRISSYKDKFIVIRNKTGIQRILLKEILYVEVKNHSLMYHTLKNNYVCSGNLKQAEYEIASSAFSKCNSCYLIHMYHVIEVDKDCVVVTNGDRLPVSRSRKKRFMEALTDYYGGR